MKKKPVNHLMQSIKKKKPTSIKEAKSKSAEVKKVPATKKEVKTASEKIMSKYKLAIKRLASR